MESVRFLLNEKGCWALKIEEGWVHDLDSFFTKHLLPFFDLGHFDGGAYHSSHTIKRGNFRFSFFYKK